MTTIPQPVENILLSDEERQHLAELRDVLSTASSPGFMRIMKRLEEDVQQACEDMLGAASAPDSHLAALTRRWQQREAVVRDIKEYVSGCENEKKLILEHLDKERSSNAEPD